MRFLFKKIYIIIFLLNIFLLDTNVFAKNSEIKYSQQDISNYFQGIISASKYQNNDAFKYLNKVKSLKSRHYKYNIEYIRTLVLLDKFDNAFSFSKNIWKKEDFFFEADLLLGLDFFIKKDYENAEKHFKRLNKISRYNYFFEDFIGNTLIAWSKASQQKENDSFKFLEKVPKAYRHIVNTQKSFLKCYFNDPETFKAFDQLIQNEDYNFERYNFFLANYLLFNNEVSKAKEIIQESRKNNTSNLLLKQAEIFLKKSENKKIKNVFNCQNPRDPIAEFFYVIANLYSSEKEYKLSNFYLKISLYLNNKFVPNRALLAENFYYQKKYINSKKNYFSIKNFGEVYSWYVAKSISSILLETKGKKESVKNLEKEFNLLPDPSFEHYYELANFYKDNEYYENSINFYSLALEKIKKNHPLTPKILDRRGTSYERNGNWEEAEKDLKKSLEILPDQPHVLNYLGYTWIDKGINLDEGLEMLKKANSLRENDGYIIDSLGWAYYAKKNYKKAEYFLQRAVELMPLDPIINDHYADTLWMLNKSIQARYIWGYVLNLDQIEKKLKDNINQKLIFGIKQNL